VAAVIAACGGGGGGGGSNSQQPNRPPVVNPGIAQTVLEQRSVTLSGTVTDPDGNPLTVQWTQDGGGPPVTLTNANTTSATFTSPAVSTTTTLLFRLTATDSQNAQAFALVNVFVDPDPLLNEPPVANAGPDSRVGPGVTRDIVGSGSDPDGAVSLFLWSQVAGPPATQLINTSSSTLRYIAPGAVGNAVMTFELLVVDNESATATDRVDVTVVGGNLRPTVDAGPDQTVLEQSTVALSGSATDADGSVVSYEWRQTIPPFVTLQTPNNANSLFTAPAVNTSTLVSFELIVTDDLGTIATDQVNVIINPDPALNAPPVANAGPDRTAAAGVVVPLDGQGSDPDGFFAMPAWTQISGVAVTINNASTFSPTFTAPSANGLLRFQLTVTDNEGATGTDLVDVTIADAGPVTGRISYDKVPFSIVGGGLDYNSIIDAPIRGAVVEAVDPANNILATTTSDASGNYSFSPPAGTFLLRVKAQMLRAGTPSWNFRVLNNTGGDALYVMQGTQQLYLGAPMTFNLRADSGWTGANYGGTRTAAPFSVLDVAYEVKELVLSATPSAQFAPLDIHWSPFNFSSSNFDPGSGAIITTHYAAQDVYVLGVQNVDTDEYDHHVIAHELGHYIQDAFSRDDSVGGPHGSGDRLDLRVAFSEGWGNAFSGVVKGDPRYRDSFGANQGQDFDLNVESDNFGPQGWFSEESVQSILYDLFDATADANDAVTLGFAPLFQVLNAGLPAIEPFTSIFPFISQLRAGNPGAVAGIDAIVNAEQIVSTTINELGSTETNNGGNAQNLPVYRAATVNGGAVQACSSTANGDDGNKLGNSRFVRFNVPAAQAITMRAAGPIGSDPDMVLYRQGPITSSVADSTVTGIEQFSRALAPGNYVLEVYDFFATDFNPGTPGNTCMNVTITSP
jgi:hypothetical protein